MALKKDIMSDVGVMCNYHTAIILQDSKKNTRIAVSSFVDEEAYLNGAQPLRSRVDAIATDLKFPTGAEVYALLKQSNIDEEGNELNIYVDAEDC